MRVQRKGAILRSLSGYDFRGCPWSEHTCFNLASNGDLQTLKWVREQGCPWDFQTCWYASNGGNLEILQWLIANGCPCTFGGYDYSQYLFSRCLAISGKSKITLMSATPMSTEPMEINTLMRCTPNQ